MPRWIPFGSLSKSVSPALPSSKRHFSSVSFGPLGWRSSTTSENKIRPPTAKHNARKRSESELSKLLQRQRKQRRNDKVLGSLRSTSGIAGLVNAPTTTTKPQTRPRKCKIGWRTKETRQLDHSNESTSPSASNQSGIDLALMIAGFLIVIGLVGWVIFLVCTAMVLFVEMCLVIVGMFYALFAFLVCLPILIALGPFSIFLAPALLVTLHEIWENACKFPRKGFGGVHWWNRTTLQSDEQ